MIKYSEEYKAYVIEFDDAVILWYDEPDESCAQVAENVRNSYLRNINRIAEVIFDEIKDFFDVEDADDVISKLGKPVINPDNGQVTYCECTFDDEHIISFEYMDDEFSDIDYVTVDG